MTSQEKIGVALRAGLLTHEISSLCSPISKHHCEIVVELAALKLAELKTFVEAIKE